MRSTMSALVEEVRLLTNSPASDYTVGSTTFISDEEIQYLLDQHALDVRYQAMTAVPTYGAGGTVTYTEYLTGYSSWEESPTIYDSTYAAQGTADYTFDATVGVVTFDADTVGAVRLITGRVYDLHAVAAEIWTRRAAQNAMKFDVSTDNHSLSRSQIVKQCNDMARTFKLMPPSYNRGRGGNRSTSVMAERPDCLG